MTRLLAIAAVSFVAGFVACSTLEYWRWTIRVADFYGARPNYELRDTPPCTRIADVIAVAGRC